MNEPNSNLPENKNLVGLYCHHPFTTMELHQNSKAFTCCPTWMKTDIGNFKKDDLENVWNSETAQKVRKSILDGTYEYCRKDVCPLIQGDLLKSPIELDDRMRKIVNDDQLIIPQMPESVMFTFDPSCNLSCPSCRPEKISYSSKSWKFDETNLIIDKISSQVLRDKNHTIRLNITGSGDPFGSLAFRQYLENFEGSMYPNLKFTFQTNGVLLTQRMWERMHKIHSNIDEIIVSIDAATEETYLQIRRGGQWDILIENMKFLSKLRIDKKLSFLQVNFVVQKGNYKELPKFIEMFQQIKVDTIFLSLMADWKSMAPTQFKDQCVWNEEHIEYDEFIEIMANPIFKSSNVLLGNLKPLRLIAEKKAIQDRSFYTKGYIASLNLYSHFFKKKKRQLYFILLNLKSFFRKLTN